MRLAASSNFSKGVGSGLSERSDMVPTGYASYPVLYLGQVTIVGLENLVALPLSDQWSDRKQTLAIEALPNGALGVVPYSSHKVLMEKSDIVNPMIVEFLEDGPAPTMMPIRRRIPDS